MGLSRCVQFIDRFGGSCDSSVEPKRSFCTADVNVNCLGNTNDRRALQIQLMSAMHSATPSQDKESIQILPLNAFDDFIRDVNGHFLAISYDLTCVRIPAIRRAQDRTPARQ